jgi:hypothetical protein
VAGLAGDLSKTRFADLRRNPDALTELGTGLGRQIVIGGTLPELLRGQLFSRASGSFGALDGVIVVREQPQDMGPGPARQSQPARVGADERDHRDPDAGGGDRDLAIGAVLGLLLPANDLSSVDDVRPHRRDSWPWSSRCSAPRAASGVKGTADRLLPDLLAPRRT